MTEIDRPFLDKARTHIDKALAAVGKELGVNIKTGNCRYSSSTFTFKLEGIDLGEDGKAVSKGASDFVMLATSFGLKPEDLGKEFVSRGETFKITGLNLKAKKYPIQAEMLSNGKNYKFPADTVCRLLSVAVSAQG